MKNKKGLTLVELIVGMFVMTILFGIVYSIFIKLHLMNEEQKQFVEIQDSLRISGELLEKDIRQSSQNLKISSKDSCYFIHDLDTNIDTKYCLNDNVLSKNERYLASNINHFELTQNKDSIKVRISSIYKEKEIKHEKTLYQRKASR